VGILAYLTRLFMIHGIFAAEVKADLARHVTSTYSTKQTKNISLGSFINCFKSPRTGVAIAVRKLLKAMLEDVDYFITYGEIREHQDEKKK
jgi:hypothetical protein